MKNSNFPGTGPDVQLPFDYHGKDFNSISVG